MRTKKVGMILNIRRTKLQKQKLPGRSPYATQLIHRPVPEYSFAVDKVLVDRAKIAAVVRHGAMVAEHKERMRRDRQFGVRAGIGIGRGNVVLVERLVVDVHLAAIDAYTVARHPDHALDVTLRRVARIAEDHNIPALNGFQPVHKLVHEDPFLVLERGHHAGSLNLHRLVEEDDDKGRNRQRNNQIADPHADPSWNTDWRGRPQGRRY